MRLDLALITEEAGSMVVGEVVDLMEEEGEGISRIRGLLRRA